jgi:hypothetical protein
LPVQMHSTPIAVHYIYLYISLCKIICTTIIKVNKSSTTIHPDTSTATQPGMAGAQGLTNW